jgi:hypothetical protein
MIRIAGPEVMGASLSTEMTVRWFAAPVKDGRE